MKKRKRVPRLWGLVLILCLNIGLLPVSVGAAEADTVLIDVGQGRVTIEPDGYMIGDQGEKVSYTGKYILTGNGSQEVYFMSGSDGQAVYDVILKDINIQSSKWKSALNIDNGVTLNLTAEGKNQSVGYNHPGLQLSNAGSGTVNIKLSPGSSLVLDCHDNNSIKSIAKAISVTIVSGSEDIIGAEHLEDRTQALSLSRGTAEPHAWVWESLDDVVHKAYCNKCSEEKGVFSHVPGIVPTEEGDLEGCIYCHNIKSADYSAVDEALGKIPGDLSLYTPESVEPLLAAKDAVIRDLYYTHQDQVDQMAVDIEKAVAGLVLSDQPVPPEDQDTPDETAGTNPSSENSSGAAVKTGDNGLTLYMAILVLGSGGAILLLSVQGILQRKNRK